MGTRHEVGIPPGDGYTDAISPVPSSGLCGPDLRLFEALRPVPGRTGTYEISQEKDRGAFEVVFPP